MEFCLAGIYAELLIDVPLDLMAFQSEEQKIFFDKENLPSIEELREKNNASNRLAVLLAENVFNSSDSEVCDEVNQINTDKLDLFIEFQKKTKRGKIK